MIRFLFLDIDGVLNSTDWYKKRPSREEWAKMHDISPEVFRHDHVTWARRSIDPEAVIRLNRLVRELEAAVVLSSTWRTGFPLTRMQRVLNESGFEHMLIGSTPCANNMPRNEDGSRLYRGDEIKAWMRTMKVAPEQIVILDDDSDMGDLLPRLVNTDHDHGLTDADVDKALALFPDRNNCDLMTSCNRPCGRPRGHNERDGHGCVRIPVRGVDVDCSECGAREGCFWERGFARCRKCGYPGQ